MHALKDKISEKLSNLFSDSPTHADQHNQVRPFSDEGNSLSSAFAFILPGPSLDRSTSDKYTDASKTTRSASFTWRSKSFSWRDKPVELDQDTKDNGFGLGSIHESRESLHTDQEYGDTASTRSECNSETFEEDDPEAQNQSFEINMHNLTEESLFITPELYRFIESSLPNLVKGCQWVLLYSTAKHGISLRTLIRNSGDLAGPCLLVAGDKKGAIFGGLLQCPLQPTAKRKYQGTSQTFVFTTIYGEPRLFRPTGANRYYYMCLNDCLAFGGGGNFALSMDGDLLNGTSGPCETFGSSCLAHDQDFEFKNIELWGFMHASKYLT